MSDVLIERFSTQAQVRDEGDAARVRRLVQVLADRELNRAFATAPLPDGLWCVRRLDVEVMLDERADSDLGREWACRVRDALFAEIDPVHGAPVVGAAPTPGTSDVVHYARVEAALRDLVSSLARLHADRAWAWRSLGVLSAGDPDPDHDPRGAVLAALGRRPVAVVPVLAAAVLDVGVAALHHLLGASGWRTLAGLVARAAGAEALLDPGGGHLDPTRPVAYAGPSAAALVRRAEAHAGRVLRRSAIAREWRTGAVRLDGPLARPVALLAVAEAEWVLLRRPDAAEVVGALAELLAEEPHRAPAGLVVSARPTEPGPVVTTPDGPRPPQMPSPQMPSPQMPSPQMPSPQMPSPQMPSPQTPSPQTPSPQTPSPQTPPAAPQRTDDPAPDPATQSRGEEPSELGAPTVLGGLVHLLATAGEAGVPDELVADPAVADLPPSAVLRALLVEMADGEGWADPVPAALSGHPFDERPPTFAATASVALARRAVAWRRTTVARLERASGQPLDADTTLVTLAALVRRRGHVRVEPGWVEVHLRLDDVDLDVRRAGLDLDPGFVPWLGAVVVIRYG